jgi:hypothetical protein
MFRVVGALQLPKLVHTGMRKFGSVLEQPNVQNKQNKTNPK